MKMIILFILSCVVLNTNGRLLTESSCSLSYVYFQPTATVTSSNIYYTTPYVAATNVTPYTNPIPTVVTNYYPAYYPSYTTYLLRKGNQSWRVSVIDAAIEKDYKVKGELYYTDSKTGEKWYTHDKVDKNFKAPFARCQQFNRELKTKNNLGSEHYKNKRVESIPEDLEVIKTSNQTPAIKSVPIVNKKAEVVAAETPKVVEATKKVEVPKVEVKAETPKVAEAPKVEAVKKVEAPKIEVLKKVEAPKVVEVPKSEVQKVVETPKVQATVTKKEETTEKKAQDEVKPALVNAANIPVEHKNKIGNKARFLQKGDDFEEEEGDMDKFNGDSVAPVEPQHKEKLSEKNHLNHLIEKHSTSNSSEDKDEADENKDEEESQDGNKSEENNENSEDSDENRASSNSEKSTSEEEAITEENNEHSEKGTSEEEAIPEENNELSDDERAIENDEETEGLMDMEEEHDQEEMEGELVHDLNPDNENNPDLL